MTTIFALSSGRPPCAIAVIRCSGPEAFAAAAALVGALPAPRTASLRRLRDAAGEVLDDALVLIFPGPATATGEDLVEFHCHGGRAVIAAVETALSVQSGLRRAEPGEFTRRALVNGRIDLLAAEGLADLLEAETERERTAALAAVEGRVSSRVRGWFDAIAMLSARVEAALDYADDDDVAVDASAMAAIREDIGALRDAVASVLGAPSVERLRAGVRIVIAGPPNAGKSTLLNLLSEREAAIVSPVSGTTRDLVEAPVIRAGLPFVLVDTAGLTETDDVVEAIGVARAEEAIASADLLVWLGDDAPPRVDALWVHARSDLPERRDVPPGPAFAIATDDPASIGRLWDALALRASALLTTPADLVSLRDHQRRTCEEVIAALSDGSCDPLIIAESLAIARRKLAKVLGIDATEEMLDALFGRFCLGK